MKLASSIKICLKLENPLPSRRGVNRFSNGRIWPWKSARIVDWCGKSRGFADFENTVDGGSAVIFYADSGLCLLNEIWVTNLSSALIGMLMSSSKLFLSSKEVHLNSGVRLLLELNYVVVIKHVSAFFTIWAKLTVACTCTSLPLNLYTSVFGCGHQLWFRIWTKILADGRIWRKKGTDRRIYIPLFTPPK